MYPHNWVTKEEIRSVGSDLSGLWVYFMQKETTGTTLLGILGPNFNLTSKTTCLAKWLPKQGYHLMCIYQEMTDLLLFLLHCLIIPLKKLVISITENSF